ncbi:unnamed protein product [Cuscuta epithymum]|uniref:Uncharacterized protein n=1 Tax=Cuscuta epithymum TaxID=186058 RepID=A0AAV0F134_9ASTE|nr:unnamed protein product [Cuscuta epithymum]
MKESPCVVIDFPQDFWWYEALPGGSVRQRIGAVDGELRLLQVVLMPYIEKAEVVLNFKVWKLNSSWVLVHDKRYRDERFLRWPNNQTLYAPFPHSTNGNVVFMVWGKTVLKCNLMMNDAYEVVHEIQEPETRTVCFPFVHPIWPTQLPS